MLGILGFLGAKNMRDAVIRKNVILSFLFKGVSLATSMLLVPMTIGYLDAYEYGVWLTLSSLLAWVALCDIGLGNGLRNNLAESLAQGDIIKSKSLISTAYFLIILIVVAVYLIFVGINHFIDWYDVLGVSPLQIQRLNSILLLSVGLFCMTMICKILNSVVLALQKTAYNELITMCGQLLACIIIYILTRTTDGSLYYVALVFMICPIIVYLPITGLVFLKQHRNIAPNIRSIDISYASNILGIGFNFFLIQIAGVVIFSTSNVIISRLFGPQEVTPYNIAFKYFNLCYIAFSIIIAPIWSAVTEAYTKRDFFWIRENLCRLRRICGWMTVAVIIMIIVANQFYKMWIGDQIGVPRTTSILMGVYIILMMWTIGHSMYINGIGKIRLQLINAIVTGILYVPVALLLCKYIGINGILVALCLSQIINVFVAPIQCNKLISGTATGIWNK